MSGGTGFVILGVVLGCLCALLLAYIGFLVLHTIPRVARKSLLSGHAFLFLSMVLYLIGVMSAYSLALGRAYEGSATEVLFLLAFAPIAMAGVSLLVAASVQRGVWSVSRLVGGNGEKDADPNT